MTVETNPYAKTIFNKDIVVYKYLKEMVKVIDIEVIFTNDSIFNLGGTFK